MWLDAASQYYYSDFGQTASFSFNNIPAGVSFTSASGEFLTAVPEPSTWAMLLLGFAGLGYAAEAGARRRSSSPERLRPTMRVSKGRNGLFLFGSSPHLPVSVRSKSAPGLDQRPRAPLAS